jgi:DNA repair protein RadD
MPPLWPIQENAIRLVFEAIAAGHVRILLTAPTGTGKSRVVCEVITRLMEDDQVSHMAQWKVVLYTNRKLLIEQLQGVLNGHGIDYGVRAAGHDTEEGGIWPVQISSLPTEYKRTLGGRWDIHGLGHKCLAIVDEAHLNNGPQAQAIFKRHVETGHTLLGVTATPLDLADSYETLLVAGTVSDGRKCGALVEAVQYDFAAPDLKDIKGVVEGQDLSENQIKKAMMRPGLMGRVFDAFDQLNPTRRPTILFAPGVAESIWFAEEFTKRGVSAAHIDGDNIWVSGELHASTPELRREILNGSREGRIVALCNRFVLREGIDCPWLGHGIFATVFGSLQSYLQSGGRLLRSHPSLERVTIQDHGGNCYRHGSLNENRDWELDLTGGMAYSRRAEHLRQNPQKQPFRCPRCGRMWVQGTRCNPAHGGCGHVLEPHKRSREVVMADGKLRRIDGVFFQPRRVTKFPSGREDWVRMFWRGYKGNKPRTFNQIIALFAKEHNGGYPDPFWPLMPKNEKDYCRLVKDVAFDDLNPAPESTVPAGTVEQGDAWEG